MLDGNSDLLPTPRWKEVVLRERLIDAIAPGRGESTARGLAVTIDLDVITDPEVLALALPYRDDLSVSERLDVAGRIVETTEEWEQRVRFLCYRAILWELHGDLREAARGFMRAVKAIPADPAPEWAHHLVVEAYVHAGRTNDREDLLKRALDLCTQFLVEANGESGIEADLRKARSEVMKRLGRDLEGLSDLRWLVEHRGLDDDRIQLGQGLIAVAEFEEARTVLEGITFEELDPGEQYDHTFALFGLLYGIQDARLVSLVRQRLADLDPEFPAWREVRSKLLLAMSQPTAEAEYPKWWASVRGSLVLQPNVFGVGVDLGKILDQLLRRPDLGREARKRPHTKGAIEG